MKELITIQSKLKAPKGQYNSFGKYHYRSCEDILEAVKPLLAETKTTLIMSDEIKLVGERYYVYATATLYNEKGEIIAHNSAPAREAEKKAGMDESQITGSASSYARKYALNGLFAIDDIKDADATNTHETKATAKVAAPKQASFDDAKLVASIKDCKTLIDVKNLYTAMDKAGTLTEEFKKIFASKYKLFVNACETLDDMKKLYIEMERNKVLTDEIHKAFTTKKNLLIANGTK